MWVFLFGCCCLVFSLVENSDVLWLPLCHCAPQVCLSMEMIQHWESKVLIEGCFLQLNIRGLSLKPNCELYMRSASQSPYTGATDEHTQEMGAQILLFTINQITYPIHGTNINAPLGFYMMHSHEPDIPLIPFNTSAVRKDRNEEGTGRGLISHTCKRFWLM